MLPSSKGIVKTGAGWIAAALLSGCHKEEAAKPVEPAVASETPAATAPVLNAELASAVQSAAAATPSGPSDAKDAPPQNGILGLERANQIAPPGGAGKIAVATEGTEPRFELGGPEVTSQPSGTMTVSTVVGQRAQLPTVDFKLTASGAAGNDGIAAVKFEVTEAALAQGQPGRIPPGLRDAVTTLLGSSFEYTTTQGLPFTSPKYSLGEKSDPKLETVLQAAADALTSVVIAYPSQPMGVGGMWMVTAREQLSLGEVVAYHLYKVEEIAPTRAVLSVKTQRYLTQPEIAGADVLQFVGSGTGDFVVVPGVRLPVEGRVDVSQQAIIQTEGEQPKPLQRDMRALFGFAPVNPEAPASATGAPSASAPPSTSALPASSGAPATLVPPPGVTVKGAHGESKKTLSVVRPLGSVKAKPKGSVESEMVRRGLAP